MENLVLEQLMDEKRLEKFINQIRDICRSPSFFKKRIDVNVSHIAWRSAEASQGIRNAITFEMMAALIIHGELRRQNCNASHPVEVVFDGRFLSD